MGIKHSTVIPLIGGITLASEEIFEEKPEYLASYSAFKDNDAHLINHYREVRNYDVNYTLLDEISSEFKSVDVVSSVCPCAGLSTMSHSAGADNPKNDWMATTAEFVLEKLKPQVYWGENAPTFAGSRGEKIRNIIYDIGRKNGYTMTVYKTKSLLHGTPQYRQRSFYFFWKEKNSVPKLNFFNKQLTTIETLLDSIKSNFQQELTNIKDPYENKYYRFILEEMHPDLDHAGFIQQLDKSYELTGYIRSRGITFPELAKWMRSQGFEAEALKCERRQAKLDSGGGIMTRALYVPKNHIHAFVGHLPTNMTHYKEARFLTYRECMSIMGLPENFELLNPKKNLNHVCQNVPVETAKDMAREIKRYLEGKAEMVSATQYLQSNMNQTDKIWDSEQQTLEEIL
jgi:site-specific DNA-cytosine methylase